jgi:tetratricopeptide (TPR) repeat protein
MNGPLLAVLGVLILVAVLLILKMRSGKAKPTVAPPDEQEAPGVLPREAPAAAEREEAVPVVAPETTAVAEAEPAAMEEPAKVVVLEQAVREEVVSEQLVPEPPAEEDLGPAEQLRPAAGVEPQPAESLKEEVGVKEVGEVEEIPSVVAVQAEAEIEPRQEPLPAAAVEEVVPEEPVAAVTAESLGEAVIESEQAEGAEAAGPAVPAEGPVMEQVKDVVAVSDLEPPAKPSETGLLLVRLSMEEYAERLNALEERQRLALVEAIAQHDDPRRDQLQRELVIMNDRLALLADQYVEEMACYQQVLDTLVRLQAEESSPALTGAIWELQSGKSEAAEAFLQELSGQTHPMAVQASFLRGQLAECRVDLQTAMECYRQAVAQEPNNPQYLRAAGLMARGLYKYKEALPWLERYVQLTRDGGRADAKAVALAQRELAYTYVLGGQYQQAGPLYKESMTVLAQKLGQDHPEMAISWQQIGEFQETMGEYDKAVSLYKKALPNLEKKRGTEHPALAGILRKLAALCAELELEAEAVVLYERLVRIQEKILRPTHPQLVISLNNLAEAYRLQGRYGEAEACYLKTLKINEEVHGAEHPSVAAILQELAKLCTSQRKSEEARQYQERASAIFQKSVEAAEKKAGAEEALTLELS